MVSKLVAVEGGHIELFWGACTTTQSSDGRLRFPLGPLTPARGKWRKWRNYRKKVGKNRRKIIENRGKNGGMPGKR